jgi:exonuclease III
LNPTRSSVLVTAKVVKDSFLVSCLLIHHKHVISSCQRVIEIDDDDEEQEFLEFIVEENDADLQQALRNSMASVDATHKSEKAASQKSHTISDSFTEPARLLHWQQQVAGASLSHAIGNFDDLGTDTGGTDIIPAPFHIVFQNTSYLVTQKGGFPVARVISDTADYMAKQLNSHTMPHVIVLGEAKLWFDDSKMTRNEAIKRVRKCYANILLDDYTLVILQPLHRKSFDGMAVYIRDDIVPHFQVFKPNWDDEARVIVTIANNQQLAIIGVYSVNGTKKSADGISRHDVRDAFDRNLEQLVTALNQHISNVVVIGDFNVTATAADSTVPLWQGRHAAQRKFFTQQLLGKLQLHDVWREQHPHSRQYTYECQFKANKGNQSRVDYALISDSLVKQAQCTLLPLDMRVPSDHSPL